MTEIRRPGIVTLLFVLNVLGAAFWLLIALGTLLLGAPENAAIRFSLAGVALALSALALLCARGLWTLRPYGRLIQLVFSWVGLIGFPLGTLVHLLILIYLFRPGVKALFSGRPVDQLSGKELADLRVPSASSAAVIVAALAGLFFIGIMFLGIVAAIAIPNLLNAIDRGKQKRTLADMRSVGTAIESYAVDTNLYPLADDIQALKELLEPTYIEKMPTQDGWGGDLVYQPLLGTGYRVRSYGKDHAPDDGLGGQTSMFASDIIFENGEFTQWPEGIRK